VETCFWEGAGSVPDRPMLTAGQLAAAIVWAIGQPPGVDVNTLTIRPLGAAIA
jgi:NADP-dependent 3-hydroxy acid dehydrogenase YdfG